VKPLQIPNTQQAKPVTEDTKKLPNTGEESDSTLRTSGLALMAMLIATLGGKARKKRQEDL
jgi:LPXTG-motif cell wall-anchored protein